MTTDFAPIAIFAYSRVEHLVRTLDALERCPEFSQSQVFIYSDGPKTEADAPAVDAVRALLAARKLPNITITEAPRNRGLANSIMAGVTDLCENFGRAIVIEDDIVVSPAALAWLNAGLDRYKDDARVWQISAHQFPVGGFSHKLDGMFLHLCTSWGWATWKRAWQRLDPAARGWERLRADPVLSQGFNLNGAYPYSAMMEQQMTGRVDSWAIRWWWSIFQAGGLCLFPPRSLVSNIGFDETATHGSKSRLRRFFLRPKAQVVEARPPALPRDVVADCDAQEMVEMFLKTQMHESRRHIAIRWLSAIGR